jgi:Flp pilus assembly pilin Flp
MTEYIIITALIAIAAIAAVAMFGGTVRNQVGGMASELGGANGTNAITRANAEGTAAATQANAAKHLNDYGNNAAQTR